MSLLMTSEEALALLNELLKEQKLKNIHELVFCYSWQGLTYPEIAKQVGYDTSYIRNIGQELWFQLSQAFEEQVTKKNIQSVLRRWLAQQNATSTDQSENDATSSSSDSEPTLLRSNLSVNTNRYQYWGEAIDVSIFYGRQAEMTLLREWIESDRCKLIALVGMGGMGKTALAAKLAEQLQNKFDYLVWQSLRNAPSIELVLTQLLKILANQQEVTQAESLSGQISQLIERLRSSRCLIVFDNVEAILDGVQAGQYRSGYEQYDELLRRIGSEHHSSCLLLTSREKPKTFVPLEGETLPVRSLSLTGLNTVAVSTLR